MTDKTIDLFSDFAVHDYVHGQLSEQQRNEFEALLETNQELRQAVDDEKALTSKLLAYDESRNPEQSVNINGLDNLLKQVEDSEKLVVLKPANDSHTTNWWGYAAAASVLVAVVIMSFNFSSDQPSEDYSLLGNAAELEKQDFKQLVDAKRVAQLMFSQAVTVDEMQSLLSEYDLSVIDRGELVWVVMAEQSITADVITALKQNEKVQKVTIISFD